MGAGGAAAGQALKAVKEQARSVPGDGLGYGLLRWLNRAAGQVRAGLPAPQIGFNYLGRFPGPGGAAGEPGEWQPAGLGGSGDPAMPALHALEADAVARDLPGGPELTLTLGWPSGPPRQAARQGRGCRWAA